MAMSHSYPTIRCVLLGLAITGLCQIAAATAGEGDKPSSDTEVALRPVSLPEETPDAETDASEDEQLTGLFRWPDPLSRRVWSLDYRVRSMFNSRTSYEFGQPPFVPPPYAPLSRLNWAMDSTWAGFQLARKTDKWGVHFEWYGPAQSSVNGKIADYDWMTASDPSRLDSLSESAVRWTEGQMLDLGGEYHLGDYRILGLPVELWPMGGFRFQRFSMVGHDGIQLIGDGVQVPLPGELLPGDLITFNQQYYIGYFGGQLRSSLHVGRLPPISLMFQGDWGATAGYNVDHHLFYESLGTHRYTMENTHGGTVHLALAAEMPLTKLWSLGVQFDHTEIHTTGSHRWLTYDDFGNRQDESWDNGVKVTSVQNSLTAYLRASF